MLQFWPKVQGLANLGAFVLCLAAFGKNWVEIRAQFHLYVLPASVGNEFYIPVNWRDPPKTNCWIFSINVSIDKFDLVEEDLMIMFWVLFPAPEFETPKCQKLQNTLFILDILTRFSPKATARFFCSPGSQWIVFNF